MKKLTSAYGSRPEADCTPDEFLAAMQKIASSGLISTPMRVRLLPDLVDCHGHCETDYNEDAIGVAGHDIAVVVLSTELLAHEVAHAVVAERHSYEEVKAMSSHGSVFCQALTDVTKVLEG